MSGNEKGLYVRLKKLREHFFPPETNRPVKFTDYTMTRDCTTHFTQVLHEPGTIIGQNEMENYAANQQNQLYLFPNGAVEKKVVAAGQVKARYAARNWLSKVSKQGVEHAAGGGYVI